MMNRKIQLLQRILCAILVFLFLAVLCGCQPSVSGTSMPFTEATEQETSDVLDEKCGTSIPLTEEKKQEINDAWKVKTGHDMPTSILYYGTYGDCVVFFQAGQAQYVKEEVIAGQEFIFDSGFALWVYRNGEFMYLEQAYKDDYITKTQIKDILEYHKSLNKQWYD
jgi:hypothetical protein